MTAGGSSEHARAGGTSWARATAPLLLRLVIGTTFLWAGLGKIFATMTIPPREAAVLANLGAITPSSTSTKSADRPVSPPATTPATPPGTAPDAVDGDGPRRPLPPSSPKGSRDGASSALGTDVVADGGTAALFTPLAQTSGRESPPRGTSALAASQRVYTADDFPAPVEVKRLWGVALRVHAAAYPPVGRFGEQPPSVWPQALAKRSWPKWLAYAVTGAEILCGALVLVGLLTRPAGLILACTMVGAVWLDQFGPAIQAGTTFLWVLPDYPRFSDEWSKLLWQALLAASSAALGLLGGGLLSIDRGIRAYRVANTDDDAL